ncbi:hypothetical protein GCM10020000_49740 [Streptomyces olivoverticillatus]
MRLFKAQMVERVMAMANVPDDVPIENKMVTRAIASAQSQVEQQNFETRKNVLKYDEVLNRQREVIYGERRRVLEGEDLQDQIKHFMDDTIDDYIGQETVEGFAEEWDLERLWGAFKQLYPVKVTIEELEEAAGDRAGITAEFIAESIKDDIHEQYAAREEQLGSDIMRELERRVVLSVLDRKWREHLYEMDYLQEGIGLRAMAQKDPLVEYQREGFDMFTAMMEGIKEESVGYLFNLEVQVDQQLEEVPVEESAERPSLEKVQDTVPAARPEIRAKGLAAPQRPDRLHFSAPQGRRRGRHHRGRLRQRRHRRVPLRGGRHDPRRAPQGAEERRRTPTQEVRPQGLGAGHPVSRPFRVSAGSCAGPAQLDGRAPPAQVRTALQAEGERLQPVAGGDPRVRLDHTRPGPELAAVAYDRCGAPGRCRAQGCLGGELGQPVVGAADGVPEHPVHRALAAEGQQQAFGEPVARQPLACQAAGRLVRRRAPGVRTAWRCRPAAWCRARLRVHGRVPP